MGGIPSFGWVRHCLCLWCVQLYREGCTDQRLWAASCRFTSLVLSSGRRKVVANSMSLGFVTHSEISCGNSFPVQFFFSYYFLKHITILAICLSRVFPLNMEKNFRDILLSLSSTHSWISQGFGNMKSSESCGKRVSVLCMCGFFLK